MNGYRLSVIGKRVLALMLCIGALPFLYIASAYAGESQESRVESRELRAESQESRVESKWLDDYSKHVGLTYNAQARIQTTYIWRALYAGGANVQASANVGYGGLYLDMWWNLGVTDWSFSKFQPEVDISLGFARWGLEVFVLYIHNFNTGLFDFHNYADRGNRLEVDVRYTVSSKLPLSFLWASRVGASDGYINEKGELVQAYSSYAEISYTQKLPYDLSLYGAFGITPWRSVYTLYERDFAVQNIELRLRKDWDLGHRCGLMLMGQLCINPSALAADKNAAKWQPKSPDHQGINANIACGIYLK